MNPEPDDRSHPPQGGGPQPPFPSMGGEQLRRFLREGFDFALVLDDEARVLELIEGQHLRHPRLHRLVGRDLQACVSVESRHKVPELMQADCLALPQGYRWRHINLVLDGSDGLPVLAKVATFGGTSGAGGNGHAGEPVLRVLVARDLSPMREMHQRFVRACAEFDRLSASLARADRALEAEVGRLVGSKPLDGIIRETVGFLERKCIALALTRSHGDRRAAALLLGLGLDDFNERYEALGRD